VGFFFADNMKQMTSNIHVYKTYVACFILFENINMVLTYLNKPGIFQLQLFNPCMYRPNLYSDIYM